MVLPMKKNVEEDEERLAISPHSRFKASPDQNMKGLADMCVIDDDEDDTDDDDEHNGPNDAVDLSDVTSQQLHFLDYDAVAPPELGMLEIGSISAGNVATAPPETTLMPLAYTSGEQLRVDKRFERDGEISDYELAASGYTKKEFTQDDNLASPTATANAAIRLKGQSSSTTGTFAKRKHFLDENPIPPDYMIKSELREHRSLDRNFERQNNFQRSSSATSSCGMIGNNRKNSIDQDITDRCSRGKFKDASYTLSRFIESNHGFSGASIAQTKIEKGTAWTDGITGLDRYSRLHSTITDSTYITGNLGPKVECVYSLLSMLGSNDSVEMSKKFLELSRTTETCTTLRRSGCIPLLVQMMHSDAEDSVRKCASMALYNVVHSHPDEKVGRREAKVLRLIEQIMEYCNFLKTLLQSGGEAIADDSERHPLAAISSLMKVSFDEEHRHAMCQLGALQAIPNLVHLDHAVHGPKPEDQCCNSLRRYALMALTNLTFGDENNKAFLCGQKFFMEALVAQLDSAPDDLLQVTASVLRNLSWRADSNMKSVLNEIGTVTALAIAAMKNKSENTLKAILSALWNLSAHCSTNKAEFCSVDGALAFLVDMLTYEGPSKTLKIIENAGGILRNVSSHIAVREDYRQILRERNCLAILLQQLKSESLTVVSNSCGTLWNLSARCPEDQKFLWDNGAVPMLRSLIHSKHNMISEGSSSALKNLLNFRPSVQNQNALDPIARSMGLKKLPTLNVRKQKALEEELVDKNLPETCDNLDVLTATKDDNDFETNLLSKYPAAAATTISSLSTATRLSRSAMLLKSESKDSIYSVKSDSVYEKLIRNRSISAVDAGGVSAKKQAPPPPPQSIRNQNIAFAVQRSAFELQNDAEQSEQPIDYSVKYKESISKKQLATIGSMPAAESNNDERPNSSNTNKDQPHSEMNATHRKYASYQETDLDQPTDFSLRYAENQLECEVDDKNNQLRDQSQVVGGNGSEMILLLEDSVKCYQTEDTPYVISNAASVSDLRNTKSEVIVDSGSGCSEKKAKMVSYQQQQPQPSPPPPHNQKQQSRSSIATGHTAPGALAYGSGAYTPEKPIYYCEEGTPGYFSRYESLSSLEESPQGNNGCGGSTSQQATSAIKSVEASVTSITPVLTHKPKEDISAETEMVLPTEVEAPRTEDGIDIIKVSPHQPLDVGLVVCTTPLTNNASVVNGIYNSAQETPLMFSRHSSMDSLAEEDVELETDGVAGDDKSSVVSDFSRLASGIISPSDIPDSPTQSMFHSPRRLNSNVVQISTVISQAGGGAVNSAINLQSPPAKNMSDINLTKHRLPLRSVFEDGLNSFQVENTPAQFSSATSLSNLSLEDEMGFPDVEPNANAQPETAAAAVAAQPNVSAISEGEDDTNNDDLLLATCINIGMNRSSSSTVLQPSTTHSTKSATHRFMHKVDTAAAAATADGTTQYCTENTPALSKVASITNLSTISINSITVANNERDVGEETTNCIEINENGVLSDNVSSNVSECADGSSGLDVLQQCIRDGMQKPSSNITGKSKTTATTSTTTTTIKHVSEGQQEIKIDPITMMRRGGSTLTADFSTITDEMSKFIVEDSPCNFSMISGLSNLTVGSNRAGPASIKGNSSSSAKKRTKRQKHDGKNEPRWLDDSLSSLSIDSEDDSNLLCQAIAAGCNRPKSNLGFNSSNRLTTFSSSKHASMSTASAGHHQRHSNQITGNDSVSSIDSSDSNDNQSKSLFELCIRTGMNKHTTNRFSVDRAAQYRQHQQQQLHNHHQTRPFVVSNPNLKCNSLPSAQQANHLQNIEKDHQHHQHHHQHRDREQKDELLLMECINTGMAKVGEGGGGGMSKNSIHRPTTSVKLTAVPLTQANSPRQIFAENNFASYPCMNVPPKNGQTTSVAALELYRQREAITSISAPNIAPDVEMKCNNNSSSSGYREGTNEQKNYPNHQLQELQPKQQQQIINLLTKLPAAAAEKYPSRLNANESEEFHANRNDKDNLMTIGYNNNENNTQTAFSELEDQSDSFNLEVSQDFSSSSNGHNIASDSFFMDVLSIENTNQISSTSIPPTASSGLQDKHKDPDLMMKSVERLTLDFVSTAEFLRTAAMYDNSTELNDNAISTFLTRDDKQENITMATNSNNTWNEDTCPNDVSFPSVSVTAPMVASLNDVNDVVYNDNHQQQQHTTFETNSFSRVNPFFIPAADYTDAEHKEINDFAEITPTNEAQSYGVPNTLNIFGVNKQNFEVTTPQPHSSLETETESSDTLVDVAGFRPLDRLASCDETKPLTPSSSGIHFIVGGEVQTIHHCSNINPYFSGGGGGSSILRMAAAHCVDASDIAFEANALAANFNEFSANSIDLDNIRPPSCMESMSISGYYDVVVPQAPQQKFPKKTLPVGLVARRALGNLSSAFNASTESINSSCNLENIKPPSLMDELLDSMFSVASIQSEIVDASLGTSISNSIYETAAGINNGNESDENSTTLQSCNDLIPRDCDSSCGGTSLQSDFDFSSSETTPKKSNHTVGSDVKRTLTPKQKRKLVKDRFKTYTITADIDHKDGLALGKSLPDCVDDNEILKIEIQEHRNIDPSADRYKTQTIIYPIPTATAELQFDKNYVQNSTVSAVCQGEHDSLTSMQAMTKNFGFITTSDENMNATAATESDFNSIECDQNSETESCSGHLTLDHSEINDEDDVNDDKEQTSPPTHLRPRIIKECDKDSGTDINTSENGSKQSNAIQVKAIRGRKKPSYISPYRISIRKPTVTPRVINMNANPHKEYEDTKIGGTFRKKNSNIVQVNPKNSSQIKSANLNHLSQKQKETPALPPPPELVRQGTFVKDEPSNADVIVPVVVSAPLLVQSSTSASLPSKLPTKKHTASVSPAGSKIKRITSRSSTFGEQSQRLTLRKPSAVGAGSPLIPQRSNSNASIRVTPSVRVALQSKRLSSTTPASRSNSNLTTNPGSSRSTVKISQTQSRIASIWKKVDEARIKQEVTTITKSKSSVKLSQTNSQVTPRPNSSSPNKNQKNLSQSSTSPLHRTQQLDVKSKTQLKLPAKGIIHGKEAIAIRK